MCVRACVHASTVNRTVVRVFIIMRINIYTQISIGPSVHTTREGPAGVHTVYARPLPLRVSVVFRDAPGSVVSGSHPEPFRLESRQHIWLWRTRTSRNPSLPSPRPRWSHPDLTRTRGLPHHIWWTRRERAEKESHDEKGWACRSNGGLRGPPRACLWELGRPRQGHRNYSHRVDPI